MKTFATPVLAAAVAVAVASLGAPAFAQSSPYDAPDAPSYVAPPAASMQYAPPSAPQGPSGPSTPSYDSPGGPPAPSYDPRGGPAAPSYDPRGTPAAAPGVAYGTVISSTPVTAQYTVRHQRCYDQPGVVQAQPSGFGAIAGAVIGGLAGNAIGAGAGRALATGAGVIGGAIAGNSIEAAGAPSVPVTTTNCTYPAAVESRIVGYDVVYEYNGQRYNTRLQRDPGSRIALDVRPSGAATPDEIMAAAATAPPYPPAPYPPGPYPVYGYPAPVYVGPPISIGFGWRGRWR
jgi:uncharacterized protein YcfJ